MKLSDFDYHLPQELIASQPLPQRDASRMMVVDRTAGKISHRSFADLLGFAREGDVWIFNDSRVERARFFSPDGKREILRLEALSPLRWRCLVRPGKKFRLGDAVPVGTHEGKVVEILANGERVIEWGSLIDDDLDGHLALPHYMKRDDDESDRERYQTVYSRQLGSIAAPTAGLHFTPEIMSRLPHAFVTLHVGVGTFQPVKVDNINEHVMHTERYEVQAETAKMVAEARRVVAVGTTACRTLETVAARHGQVVQESGKTDIFLRPGSSFKAVGALLTNFHLPKSSLIMLVSAFAGRDLIMEAYAQAVQERYRFFSYGDCMLIV
ncbi:MAG: tRNA preQ1(34) S-adenosylmethionine ribosyltransferase-isomerase QueA [Verrucomicrobiaceae bacterium]|nr:tRNA preQ1(34) S-adenosylmethionine ribosyltransferase-isomerase QueA [Verrucomicrobiaceae bacterium]